MAEAVWSTGERSGRPVNSLFLPRIWSANTLATSDPGVLSPNSEWVVMVPALDRRPTQMGSGDRLQTARIVGELPRTDRGQLRQRCRLYRPVRVFCTSRPCLDGRHKMGTPASEGIHFPPNYPPSSRGHSLNPAARRRGGDHSDYPAKSTMVTSIRSLVFSLDRVKLTVAG